MRKEKYKGEELKKRKRENGKWYGGDEEKKGGGMLGIRETGRK